MAIAGYMTWLQIWTVLQNGELDLNDAALVTKAEAMEYANEAIREASALIHTIYEDYFLTKVPGNLSLVQGQETVNLPSGIYAMKIRDIIYTNGNIVYPLERLREWAKFIAYRLYRIAPTQSIRYRYFITNSTPGQPTIMLSPPAQESGAYLETWYLRRANEFAVDGDICDIPEFVQYIYDHVRVKVYEKDGHPQLAKAIEDKAATRQLMIDTLTEMVPDHQNSIEADMSLYMEHS